MNPPNGMVRWNTREVTDPAELKRRGVPPNFTMVTVTDLEQFWDGDWIPVRTVRTGEVKYP